MTNVLSLMMFDILVSLRSLVDTPQVLEVVLKELQESQILQEWENSDGLTIANKRFKHYFNLSYGCGYM